MELKPEMFKKLIPLPLTVLTTVDASGITNAAPYGCVMPVLRPLDLIAIASALRVTHFVIYEKQGSLWLM